MYKAGDKVKYRTCRVKYLNGSVKRAEEKSGVIEEVFHTVDMEPCYWIEGEKELILGSQIMGIV